MAQMSQAGDLTSGPMLKKIILFSLPLAASSFLQLLFNAADVVVVGRFVGSAALAAVGSNGALINLLVNLFVGLALGANVVAARCYGAKDDQGVHEAVQTAVTLSLVGGVLMAFVGFFAAHGLLELMSSPEDVIDLATLYLKIYFIGMPMTMLYNFNASLLRAVGDTRRPLVCLAVAGVINVVLNLFFVIVLKMDVAGVGMATAISQWVSAILIFRCLTKVDSGIRVVPRDLRIHKDKLAAIFQIGLPAGVQGVIFSLTNVLIQASVNSFGAIIVAGNSAAANLEGFIYFAMNAFYQATISFTSQNVGARRIKRIDKVITRGELCVVAVGLGLGLLTVTFGRTLLSIYSPSDAVIDAGMERLKIIAMTYALCGAMDVMVGSLRGMGCSVTPMLVSLVGVCGIRIIWLATIFQIPKFHTMNMLFLTYPLTWILTLTAHVITFLIVRKRLREQAVARLL